MHSEQGQPVVALGDFVAGVVSAINSGAAPLYPVLGAEGHDFFIEVAAGPFESRQILKTARVEIREELDHPVLPEVPNTEDEVVIFLPTAAFLVGLLGLFQQALNAGALILHPLDDCGDFLPGWNQAVIAAASKKRS